MSPERFVSFHTCFRRCCGVNALKGLCGCFTHLNFVIFEQLQQRRNEPPIRRCVSEFYGGLSRSGAHDRISAFEIGDEIGRAHV